MLIRHWTTSVIALLTFAVVAPAAIRAQPSARPTLRAEIDSLHAAMVAAFKHNPASVASFYSDDARIIGLGSHHTGRTEVDQYWRQGIPATDWILEVVDVGGTPDSPWVLGRSTLVAEGGRRMVTDYLAILVRGADGRLRYRIDLYTPAEGMTRRPG